MSAKEQIYDEKIAPALLAIADLCKDNGLSMIATVQYGTAAGERGTTFFMQDDASLPMVMAKHCIMTAPNIDGYIIGLTRYCAEKGIDTTGSIVMRSIGGAA